MLQHNLSCLPLLDQRNGLVGILFHSDFGLSSRFIPLAEHIYTLLSSSAKPEYLEEVSREMASKQVKDVMAHPVVTVQEDAPTAQVAEIMVSKRVHRVPVMRSKELVGIITRYDLLKLIVSSWESLPGNYSCPRWQATWRCP